MANIDSQVAKLVDKSSTDAQRNSDSDEDDLIAQLENDTELDGLRERRREQLHSEFVRARMMRESGHGTYEEIKDEKKAMDITTSTKLVVIHFAKSDFTRCRIMDQHLQSLAEVHLDTRFIRVDVTNAPFLVVKLKVQVLPCVIAFVDGVSTDRIIGFEGLGRGTDKFTTKELEARLLSARILTRPRLNDDNTNKRGTNYPKSSIRVTGEKTNHGDGSDYDDDSD